MTGFFATGAFIASFGLLGSLAIGHGFIFSDVPLRFHLLLGLGSAVFTSLLHCLVFAIFTGSGKDARLLVERFSLSAGHLAAVKRFRREIFPPALKAIGALLLVSILGGAIDSGKLPGVLAYLHPVIGWFAVAYNLWVFKKELLVIAANGRFIRQVNEEAARELAVRAEAPQNTPETMAEGEFARHAHAMGRFCCFLAYNAWLPYLYLRFSMAMHSVSWKPFLAVSLVLWCTGKYWQRRYAITSGTAKSFG